VNLDSPILVRQYAATVRELYDEWGKTSENARRNRIDAALRSVAAAANLPFPTIVWAGTGSSFFRTRTWEIQASLWAVQYDPHTDFKDWLHKVTSPYHELRHADQHRILLEAYMTQALALPVTFSRAIAPEGHRVSTIQAQEYPYPVHLLTRLRTQKNEFRQSQIPQARAWSDSFYGSHANARNQTMNTLMTVGKGKHYGAYRNLPEEADAFAVQTSLKREIKSMIHDVDEDLDLTSLFG
jgi:hypothetical protein